MDETAGPNVGNSTVASPRHNPWAIAAILCSAVVFCLPLTLLGPLLGLFALREIKRGYQTTGRRLAVAALVIGIPVSAAWIWGFSVWHVNIRRPMIDGPQAALQAGLAGDLDGFRAGFHGTGASASDEAVEAFLGELGARYGGLVSMAQRAGEADAVITYQMQGYRIPYRIQFETGPINAEARFVITAPDASGLVGRFEWLAVIDSEQGDLVYPIEATDAVFAPEMQVDGN